MIQVTFSEPLDVVSAANAVAAFTLNDGQLALDTTSASFDGRTLTIKSLSNLVDGSTYTLKLKANSNLADNAGYKVSPATLSFVAQSDTTAPTAGN